MESKNLPMACLGLLSWERSRVNHCCLQLLAQHGDSKRILAVQ